MPVKRKQANQILLGKRKKIYRAFWQEGKSIQQIVEDDNVSYWQVYRIVKKQVKLDGSRRADYKRKRKGEIITFNPDNYQDIDDIALLLLMQALEQCASEKSTALEKADIARKVNDLQTKIQQRQLITKMRRPDAEVIARIIRRFNPKADYKTCVEIYQEELEKYNREK